MACYGSKISRLRENIEEIKQLYWEKDFTHKELSKRYGCSRQLVNKHSKELGISGVITSSRNIRERHQGYKGGKCYSPKNGVQINQFNGKHKLEHVLIAEKTLGRPLKKGEVVHHVNGDNRDNRNCNLLICKQDYHATLHQKMSHLYMKEKFGGIQV